MVKMTVSARQNRLGQGFVRLGRVRFLLLVISLICIIGFGWGAVGIVHAADEGPADPTAPLPSQPTVLPTENPQIESSAPPPVEEPLVWPWKQENPEPKARLARLGLNALDIPADESISHSVSAANNVTSIGQMGGASFRVAVSGGFGYIGSGYKMTILNIANPASLSVVGKTNSNWADEVLGISVQGNYAYVATGNEGLRIVDVSNAKQPVEVGFYNTPGYAWDVALDGNYAYIADGENGLQIVDVTTAYAPQLKANLKMPGIAMDVVIAGTYAYLADEREGLRIVNIADPTYPVEAGFVKTQGRAVGLAVAGNYAFLAADTSGLRIVDVTNKSAPREVAAFDTRGNAYAVDIDATANTAFVADAGEGLRAVDISNKNTPREAGHFDVAGCWANDIRVNGSYAYLIDTSHGLRVLNVTNPGELSQVYLYNSPAPTDVKVSKNYAYVPAGSAGLRVIDVRDMSAPTETGYFDTPGYAYAVDLVVPPGSSSTYACVADWEKGLRVIDVTNAAAPYEVGAADTPGMARGVAVLWPYAYVADDTMGLQIVSLNDLASPAIVGVCDQEICMPAGGSAHGVTLVGQPAPGLTFAYVADGDKGLRLIDVSDPANPVQVGFYDTPGQAQNVALSPTQPFAYVADGFSGGLQIVDISSPSGLVSLGAVDTDGSANALSVLRSAETSGDIAFLADGTQGLRVFSIEAVAGGRPVVTEKGFYDTRGWAGSLTVVEKYPYIADGEDGLRILEVSGAWMSRSLSGRITDNLGNALAGVTITVNPGASIVTDNNGNYSIKGLPPQSVVVTPSLNGFIFSPNSLTINLQESVNNVDFIGSRSLEDGFAGHILDTDGRPLAGVVIKYGAGKGSVEIDANSPIITDAQGLYVVQGLKKGRYTITPHMEGYTFKPLSASVSVPAQAGQDIAHDFVGQQIKGSATEGSAIEGSAIEGSAIEGSAIKGIVADEEGNAIDGVAINGDCGISSISDDKGNFELKAAAAGALCTLTPTKDGYSFAPMKFVIDFNDVGAMEKETPQQIVAYTNRLTGKVSDKSGRAVAGVEVSLSSGSQAVTDQAGTYLFNGVASGTYMMLLKKEGYSFSPAAATVAVPKDQNLDFTAYAAIYPFGGVVRDEGGLPLAGVVVGDGAGHQVTTDENGVYLMALPGGTYTLTPAKDGLDFEPSTRQVIVGPGSQSQDFSVKSAEYSISGVIRSQGKPLAGVTLSDDSGDVVTSDENGAFRWSAKAGSYVLTPLKTGFSFVPDVLRVTFPAVNEAVIEIEAQEGAFVLGGIVLAQDGSPLAGVSIGDSRGQSVSDRMGEFTLARLPGTYTFRATKDGYAVAPESFDATFPGPADGKKLELLATPLCPNYVLNGDFERDGDWSPQGGVQAEYSQEAVFRGGRAAIVGPTQGSKPLDGHITLRQKVSLPKKVKSADLRFMLYLFGENTTDAAGGAQQVLILDKNEKSKERALTLHGDDREWKPYRIDMLKYTGQTIWISFDVANDGKGSNLGMNIDDVTLQVCE